jgi:REP element-mobilizing transposase RayT
MARPLRIVYEGAFYHITARGNEQKNIFLSKGDFEKFLSYLTDAIDKYDILLHAYVFMSNHYRLFVETPEANLNTFMHGLSRRRCPISNSEIGKYFGGISYSAITKIGTRLKERLREDGELKGEIRGLEERLSRVKG